MPPLIYYHSKHRGKGGQRFKAEVRFKEKKVSLGSYVEERDAARAVDDFIAAKGIDRPLNLPRGSGAGAGDLSRQARKRCSDTTSRSDDVGRRKGEYGGGASSRRKRARRGSAAADGSNAGATVSALLQQDPPPPKGDEVDTSARFRDSCALLSREDLLAVAVGLKSQTWRLLRCTQRDGDTVTARR